MHQVRTSTTRQPSINSKVSPVVMSLPVSVEGALPRLWYTRSRLKSLRSSIDPFILYVATSALMSIAPATCVRSLISAVTEKTASVQFSWLSGPVAPILINGCELKAIYSLVPAQSCIGIAVSVFTYSEQIYLTVSTDSALGQTGEVLLHHINLQINRLYELLHNRRIPGEGHRGDTINVCSFPNIRTAPIDSIVERMYKVQQEIQKICESKRPLLAERERCQCLKAEFTILLKELRRRKTINNQQNKNKKTQLSQDPEEDDFMERLRHRRSMSCPFVYRPNLSGLNLLAGIHGSHSSAGERDRSSPITSPLKTSGTLPRNHPCQAGSPAAPLKNIPTSHAQKLSAFTSVSPTEPQHSSVSGVCHVSRTISNCVKTNCIFSSTRIHNVDDAQNNHVKSVPSFSLSQNVNRISSYADQTELIGKEPKPIVVSSHSNGVNLKDDFSLYVPHSSQFPEDSSPQTLFNKVSSQPSTFSQPYAIKNNHTIIRIPEFSSSELSTIIAYDNSLPINSTCVDI